MAPENMLQTVNIHDAKTQFSKLVARAVIGEEIIIAKPGKPVARLVPMNYGEERITGIAEGSVTDAFFDPLPDDELKHWE
jgi:prevent-host-death family protein